MIIKPTGNAPGAATPAATAAGALMRRSAPTATVGDVVVQRIVVCRSVCRGGALNGASQAQMATRNSHTHAYAQRTRKRQRYFEKSSLRHISMGKFSLERESKGDGHENA